MVFEIANCKVYSQFCCAAVIKGVLLGVLLFLSGYPITAAAMPYDIGLPTLQTIWVDPATGNDSASGQSHEAAVRTVIEAWSRIPESHELTNSGYQILLAPGEYGASTLPNYWENRFGTRDAPIILQSSDVNNQAVFTRDINLFNSRYLYFLNFKIVPRPAGDVMHCEQCDHLLLRGMTLNGMGEGSRAAHETLKVNQSQHVYIEHSDIFGSYENNIDFVAVQYGQIIGNRIHDADDWCAYTKGGSANLLIESNRIYNCGTGGYTAGQGTGFEYMTAPWLHYEAYDIKFINNLVWNTEGAGVGVNGGYNILIAHNTFYRVGVRSHAIEFVFGSRSCDGDAARCLQNRSLGGWGPAVVGGEEPIPNHSVFVFNNLLMNPSGSDSRWSHLTVQGPRIPSSGSGIPSPAAADADLVIRGNVLWNGPSDLSLGVGDEAGCRNANPTCNEAQIRNENLVNSLSPQFLSAETEDFRLSSTVGLSAVPIPDFSGIGRPSTPAVPQGVLNNTVDLDFAGNSRQTVSVVGALLPGSSLIPGSGRPPSNGPPPNTSPPGRGPIDPGAGISVLQSLVSPERLPSRGGRVAVIVVMSGAERVHQLSVEIRSNLTSGVFRFLLRSRGNGIYSGVSTSLPANRDRRRRRATLSFVARAIVDGGEVVRLPITSISQQSSSR